MKSCIDPMQIPLDAVKINCYSSCMNKPLMQHQFFEVPVDRAMVAAVEATPVSPVIRAVAIRDIDGLTFVRVGIVAGYCAMCGEHNVEHGMDDSCQAPLSRPGDRFVRDGALDRWMIYNPFLRQAITTIRFKTLIDARNWAISHLCIVNGSRYQTREWKQR